MRCWPFSQLLAERPLNRSSQPSSPHRGFTSKCISLSPAYASPQELLGRMLSPFGAEATRRKLAATGTRLGSRSLLLDGETFLIYVPVHEPQAGYRLLVFIPPWPSAQLPDGWRPVLDRNGVILVSADRSGNDDNVLARRVPLGLVALANVTAAFRIDPRAIWIGGFSGGSRVALRLALAYPDLFTGAFLNAGSDPIAADGLPLPPPDRFERFRTNVRLVYSTGDQDSESAALDILSLGSMRHWCVENVISLTDRGRSHEPASPAVLQRALDLLTRTSASPRRTEGRCDADRAQEVSRALDAIETDVKRGQNAEARQLLLNADRRFGGLAAPRSIMLADRCRCGLFDPSNRAGASPGR